ncbi:Probable transmembrane protein of unknown function [Flavobacterium indicum GPTSA100-9 = DSM 17447]|uniref:Uncharacterized protein n=1 Tax=Flavobacterium indicum (strain DSM 17447 / CIP 109464 / GPTSA100-9) TaxID=1094466 RepID=H8XS91_FLAIG|nr:hypothetical protein [Flavobacterium indicum]CCG54675.1 Probable transmembrane protein of unknown function [Flavobacterium indicum GPTSA100-9 = DSM 17447]
MSNNIQDQELDLTQIGQGIKNFFNKIINKCFDFLFFIIEKKVVIISLFILGVIGGYFLDKGKTYSHTIAVIPNFGSNDYLYNQIDFLDKKLAEKDTLFFNSIGVKNSKNILSFEVEATQQIYNFITDRERGPQNLELIKLMAEDGDIDKILKDELTSKQYYLQNIIITTKGKFKREQLVDPFLKYLNNSLFFLKQKETNQENVKEKIALNDSLIKQIDGIIQVLSKNNSNSSITISEKSSVAELIDKKDKLIQESQYLKLNDNIYDKVIKDENVSINNLNKTPIFLKMKVILPLLLIFIYLLFYSFSKLYKKQKARLANS